MADGTTRPDTGGYLGGRGSRGSPRPRGDGYPYDRGPEVPYGIRRGLTPADTSHSAWDELSELMGVPFDVSQSEEGTSDGTEVPGAHLGWSGMPPRPWDDPDGSVSFDEEAFPMSIDDRVPTGVMLPAEPREVPRVDLTLVVLRSARDLLDAPSAWGGLVGRSPGGEISGPRGGQGPAPTSVSGEF